MIQKRSDDWMPNTRVSTNTAADVQSLLQAIVARYSLMGAVLATDQGEVRAQVGPSLDDATDGFTAALAGHKESLAGLAGAIAGKTMPRYFSQGELDAYADTPGPGLVALFMRQRGAGDRSELQMVSEYKTAQEMTDEFRAGLRRLGLSG